MNVEELVVAIRVSAENADAAIESIKSGIESVGGSVEMLNKEGGKAFEPMKRGANEAAAAQAALAAASATTFAAIAKAVEGSTAAYNEFTAAQKGLQSIASGKGINQDALKEQLDGVTDAFLDAGSAATAYKNLLSRGYSLEQATTTIERLKDAAAFGRAANLSLADAVVTATEGIRQENSILVDNAGVTKNVAKMWEDYAKARGLTTASLTQAQKVEAEYLGIIQETQLQVGDLAKAADTLAGAQAENAAQATALSIAYGSAMAPAIQGVTEAATGLFEGLTGIISAAPSAASGITATAAALALLITGLNGAKGLIGLFGAGALAINPAMIALAAGVGVVTAAYTAYKTEQEKVTTAQEEAARAAEAERTANEKKVKNLGAQATELSKLAKEYETLTSKESLTVQEAQRLDTLTGILITQYGLSEAALKDLAGGYDSGNDAIQDRIEMYHEEMRALMEKQRAEKQALIEQKAAENYNRASIMAQLVIGGKPEFEKASNLIRDEMGNIFDDTDWKSELDIWLASFYGKAPEVLQAAQEIHDALYNVQSAEEAQAAYNAYFNGLRSQSEAAASEIETLTGQVEALNQAIENPAEIDVNRMYGGDGGVGSNLKAEAEAAAKSAQEATEWARKELEYKQQILEAEQQIAILQSETATEAEKRAAAAELESMGYGNLYGNQQGIIDAQAFILQQSQTINESYAQARAELEGQIEALERAYETGDIGESEYFTQLAEMVALLDEMPKELIVSTAGMTTFNKTVKTTADTINDLKSEAVNAGKKLENALTFREEIRSMKSLAKGAKDAGGGWDDLTDEIKTFAKGLGVAEGDIDGAIAALEKMEAQTGMNAEAMVNDLEGTLSTLENLRAELMSIPPAELTADNSQALESINQAIALINFFLSLAGKAGIAVGDGATKKRGGGGGGGKKDDGAEAARAAEQAQEEAYRAELERIEHRRRLNQITAQEEIRELERVKREYAKTAEQIMDIDERIYDARQALRDEEEGKITSAYDAIVEALENRYEEQREIEQRRISDSIEAWEKWSDETCAAIQKQIDALEEQAQAEDREKTRAENLRKIAKLEQALIYETDEYNQDQLKKQIQQAKEAWDEVQADWDREDRRDALENQMQAVQNQAQAEIDKLEEESERIDSVYDSMLEGASLAAEAQKLLMQSTQEDILQLLANYAPDYEATGRTLGEKIYDGFKAAFGDVSAFFEQIDAQFEAMTDKAQQVAFGKTANAQAAGETVANVSSPTINQTVNFNQPVESPADVARRMQRVSEELAGMM